MPPNEVKGTAALNGHYSPLRAAQSAGAASTRPASWEPTNGGLRKAEPKSPTAAAATARDQRWSEHGASQLHPVREMDAELRRLREAPVQVVSAPGKYQVSVDMSIFRPEDIQLLLSPGRLLLCAEREVRLDDCTSVVRQFRRQLSVPEDVSTDAVATLMSSRGILTVTVLRRARG